MAVNININICLDETWMDETWMDEWMKYVKLDELMDEMMGRLMDGWMDG